MVRFSPNAPGWRSRSRRCDSSLLVLRGEERRRHVGAAVVDLVGLLVALEAERPEVHGAVGRPLADRRVDGVAAVGEQVRPPDLHRDDAALHGASTRLGVAVSPARSASRMSRWTRCGGVGAAAVLIEAPHVEPQPLAQRPQVRVLEVALVGVDGVGERPERVLLGRRLGGVRERQRPRVAGLEREVAQDHLASGCLSAAGARPRTAGT